MKIIQRTLSKSLLYNNINNSECSRAIFAPFVRDGVQIKKLFEETAENCLTCIRGIVCQVGSVSDSEI